MRVPHGWLVLWWRQPDAGLMLMAVAETPTQHRSSMAQENNGCATGCFTLLGLVALGFVLAYWQAFLLPPPSGKLSPVLLTTRGLKEMTSAAIQRGCQS